MFAGFGVSRPNGLSNPILLSRAVLRSETATCTMAQQGQQQAAPISTIHGSLGSPMSARAFDRDPAMRQGAHRKKAGTHRPPQSFLSSTNRSLHACRMHGHTAEHIARSKSKQLVRRLPTLLICNAPGFGLAFLCACAGACAFKHIQQKEGMTMKG